MPQGLSRGHLPFSLKIHYPVGFENAAKEKLEERFEHGSRLLWEISNWQTSQTQGKDKPKKPAESSDDELETKELSDDEKEEQKEEESPELKRKRQSIEKAEEALLAMDEKLAQLENLKIEKRELLAASTAGKLVHVKKDSQSW